MTFLSFLVLQYLVVLTQVTIAFVTESNVKYLFEVFYKPVFIPLHLCYVLGCAVCYWLWFSVFSFETLYFSMIPLGILICSVFRILWEFAEASKA